MECDPRHVLVSSSNPSSLFCTLVPQGHSWVPQGEVITVQSHTRLGFWAVMQCWGPSAPCLSCGTAARRTQRLKTKQLAHTEIPASGKTSSLLQGGKGRGPGWGQCQGHSSIPDLTVVLEATGRFGTAQAFGKIRVSLLQVSAREGPL